MALWGLLKKYRAIFLRYKTELALGVLALGFTNGLGLLIPLQIKAAVDAIQAIYQPANAQLKMAPDMLWQGFYSHLWIIAGLAVLVLICRVASRHYLLGAGRRLEFDLRNRLYGHLLKMPASYFAAHPPGELMSRMTNDVDATKYLTGGGIMLGVNTLLAYTLTIPMMLSLNWKLALVTFLLYPIVIVFMGKISKKVRQGFYDVQTVLGEISTVAQENLNGMMVIQSYVRESQENQRFQKVCDAYFGAYTRLIHERILLFMLLAGLSGISTGLVLLVGGWQVIEKQLDWGGFVAFTMYLEHLAWPTMALGWTISIFQQGTAALQRLDEVFSAQSNIQDGSEQDSSESAATQPPVRGAIEIRNLTFTYQNPYAKPSPPTLETEGTNISESENPEMPTAEAQQNRQPVLRDVSLTIRPGETVALVGSVGSGKSTLLRLLPRVLEVPEKTVFLDGQDITQLPLGALRANMVFMPQASFLFSTSVQQNIAFGQPELLENNGKAQPSLEPSSIVQAAQTASVHMDIQGLPQRYQTLVGERGLMLSGGQRQRVALARAILVDAKVLVLDDPVSNVDADTERNIVSALRARKVFSDKTTLIATHRFSLVSLCDRVVLMDAGKILAVGTHAELLATQPLYQNLNRLQELRASLGDWALEGDTGGQQSSASLADDDEDLAELLENASEGAAS